MKTEKPKRINRYRAAIARRKLREHGLLITPDWSRRITAASATRSPSEKTLRRRAAWTAWDDAREAVRG